MTTAIFPRARNCTTRRAGPGRPRGSLDTARQDHTATLLPNGIVVVAGGHDSNGNTSASAELYDPASGTWTATGSLNTARDQHTATLLPNGMVLVAGGLDSNFDVSASAELYDPASGAWTATAASTPAVICTRRPCCPTGWCWLQGDLIAAAFPRARNCTTRPAGPGRPQAASTPRVMSTLRPCCPTGWCWLQGDLIATAIFP
jgi:hypothetical protein